MSQHSRKIYRRDPDTGEWSKLIQVASKGGSWWTVHTEPCTIEEVQASHEQARIAIRQADHWRFA